MLGSLALAQPLFDLIGRQPEFLAVRHLDGLDVVIFVALAMVLPCALVLPVTGLLRLLSRPVARALHGLAVAVLTALILLPILLRLGLTIEWLALAVALGAGVCWARVLSRPAGSALWFRWLPLLLVIAIPGLFLGQPGVAALLSAPSTGRIVVGGGEGPLPSVVMLVFDEFALADVLDADGAIDGETFPNFARLAQRSDWFPGHQTVADGTTHAVPAILTGRRLADPALLPILADHPRNLFTLLAPTHELLVHESATSLKPRQREVSGRERTTRQLALALDAAVVWAQLVLPVSLRGDLPEITSTWGGFVQLDELNAGDDASPAGWLAGVAHELGSDRRALFDALLAGLAADEPPTLHYLHVLLPHAPLQYLPLGATYSLPVKGVVGGLWGADEAALGQAWQRHLMQLAFADRQLGRLLDKLDALQLFDDSMIVVTADHGAGFSMGEQPRALSPGNLAEILPVPLFIKRPGQRRGEVHEGFAETVDILPTMLELLGLEPLTGDRVGRSLVGGARDAPSERTLMTFVNGGSEQLVPGVIEGLHESAARRRGMFPRPGQTGLFAIGPRRELLDRELSELPIASATTLARVTDVGALQSAFTRETTPRVLQGHWLGESAGDLVLAVNGTVRATTRSLQADALGLQQFTLFVPEVVLKDQGNRLALFAVTSRASGDGSTVATGATAEVAATVATVATQATAGEFVADFVLQPVSSGPGAYQLRSEQQREWLVDPGGQPVELSPDALRGRCKVQQVASGDVVVSGWAYDAAAERPVAAVVAFAGQRFLLAVTADDERPSLVEMFGQGALRAGFRATLQSKRLGGADVSEVRVFAVSAAGEGSELERLR